jgi:hypothetical protein
MKLKLFTVYDSKAEAYNQPFYMPSTGAALRAFEDSINDPQNSISQHPGDYTLFELGTFDPSNASIQLLDTRKNLGVAIEFVRDSNAA